MPVKAYLSGWADVDPPSLPPAAACLRFSWRDIPVIDLGTLALLATLAAAGAGPEPEGIPIDPRDGLYIVEPPAPPLEIPPAAPVPAAAAAPPPGATAQTAAPQQAAPAQAATPQQPAATAQAP